MHLTCISQWLQTSLKCPICKKKLTLSKIKSKIKSRKSQSARNANSNLVINDNGSSPDHLENNNDSPERVQVLEDIGTDEEAKDMVNTENVNQDRPGTSAHIL